MFMEKRNWEMRKQQKKKKKTLTNFEGKNFTEFPKDFVVL